MIKRTHDKIAAFTCLVALLIQVSACAVHKQTGRINTKQPFTILGLGDSITEGSGEFFSYLFPLDSMLKQSGYQPKFIGPRHSQQEGNTIYHFGYGGRTAEYLAAHTDSVYTAFPADIVLLHTGHNHFVEESPVAGIIAAQRSIIQTIRNKNPKAIIFVASVITSGKLPKYEYIPSLNIAIKEMAASFNDPAIIFIDQQNGWDWEKYTIGDKVHPNRLGAKVIASKWFEGIIHLSRKK